MNRIMKFAVGAAMATTMATSFGAVQAATPADTLVQAWQIDDIISLDPGELFEITASEIGGNTYERLIGYDPADVSKVFGVVAESWTVSDDGKTFTFKIREGRKFASGNPITAADVVYSIQRVIDARQDAGLHPRAVRPDQGQRRQDSQADERLRAHLHDRQALRPDLRPLLPDGRRRVGRRQQARQGARDGRRLRQRMAEDQLCRLRPLHDPGMARQRGRRAGEQPELLRQTAPLARVIYRHIPETATQRLLLEKGDIDVARNLGPEEIAAVSSNPDIKIQSAARARSTISA